MPNSYFQFKQFTIHQDQCAMKVTTDGCLFGAVLAALPDHQNADFSVLDIGTGTGLLSLMFAQKHPNALIDTVEFDADAFAQATQNASSSPWKDRINCIHSDVREYPFTKKYDCIFSNPPFYESEMASSNLKKNMAHHHSGLRMDELCRIIKDNLKQEGHFHLLLPAKREKHFEQALLRNSLFIHKKLQVRQSVNHDHFRIIVSGGLTPTNEIEMSELAICDAERQYSNPFKSLLKDYYLHL